jgi:hypothetical protein
MSRWALVITQRISASVKPLPYLLPMSAAEILNWRWRKSGRQQVVHSLGEKRRVLRRRTPPGEMAKD